MRKPYPFAPAKAEAQRQEDWVPACAGTNGVYGRMAAEDWN
jgi:hypothetical protein